MECGGCGLLSRRSFICCTLVMATGMAGVLRLYFRCLPALICIGGSCLRCRPNKLRPALIYMSGGRWLAVTVATATEKRFLLGRYCKWSRSVIGVILLAIAVSIGWGRCLGSGCCYRRSSAMMWIELSFG